MARRILHNDRLVVGESDRLLVGCNCNPCGGNDCLYLCYGGELGTGGGTEPHQLCVGESFTDSGLLDAFGSELPGCPQFTTDRYEFSFDGTNLTVGVYCNDGGVFTLVHTESFAVAFNNTITRNAVMYQNPATEVFFVLPLAWFAPSSAWPPGLDYRELACCDPFTTGDEYALPAIQRDDRDAYFNDFSNGLVNPGQWTIINEFGILEVQPDLRIYGDGFGNLVPEMLVQFSGVFLYDPGTTSDVNPFLVATWPSITLSKEFNVFYSSPGPLQDPNAGGSFFQFQEVGGAGGWTIVWGDDAWRVSSFGTTVFEDNSGPFPENANIRIEEEFDFLPNGGGYTLTGVYQRVERFYIDGMLIHTRDNPTMYPGVDFACQPRTDSQIHCRVRGNGNGVDEIEIGIRDININMSH